MPQPSSSSASAPAPLRVLFLNPPAPNGNLWPRTDLAYLAAMTEGEGHTARVIDAMLKPMTLEELQEECHAWKPDLIVARSDTPTIRNDAIVLDHLAHDTAAICGFIGPHASALPEQTLRESMADFVLVDEAEEMIAELVWSLSRLSAAHSGAGDQKTAGAVRHALSKIDGLAWRASPRAHEIDAPPGLPQIVVNQPRSRVANLDEYLPPARHLLDNDAYRLPYFGDHPFASVIPARGCLWACSFCRTNQVAGRAIRVRSISSILEEIESLRKDYGITRLVFQTDSLILDRDWARELFRSMAQDLEKQPEWICRCRVDMVDEAILNLMQQAGCRAIHYGAESGSRRLLRENKKAISLEQTERAIWLTRLVGIETIVTFLFGLPGETEKTIYETIRFAKRLNPDFVRFDIVTPWPGTPIYETALAKNRLLTKDFEAFGVEDSPLLLLDGLDSEALISAKKRAARVFYLQPRRLARKLRTLARVRSWRDIVDWATLERRKTRLTDWQGI